MNRILKILCSIPVIIGVGYFLPFLGVCLIVTRYFIYNNRKYYLTSLSLIIIGTVLLIPKVIVKICEIIKVESNSIPYLNVIVNYEIYPALLNYSKFLIIVGVLFLILSTALKNLFNKVPNLVKNYINKREKADYEISQKNDMKIKIKQEKAKNTKVVYCPHCGADNILTEITGICKYCRRNLNNK